MSGRISPKAGALPQGVDRATADSAAKLDELRRFVGTNVQVATNYTFTVGVAGSGAQFQCDGKNDEVEIAAAVKAAAAVRGTVSLLPGTYRVSAPIKLLSGVTIDGNNSAKLLVATDFPAGAAYVMGTNGGPKGAGVALNFNAVQGNTSVNIASWSELPLVRRDEYLFLLSEADWDSTSTGRKRGEWIKVISTRDVADAMNITAFAGSTVTATGVTSRKGDKGGAQVTVTGCANAGNNGTFPIASWISDTSCTWTNAAGVSPDAGTAQMRFVTHYGMVRDEYNTADTAMLWRAELVEDVIVRGLVMTQEAEKGSRTNTPPMLNFRYTHNLKLQNLHIYGSDGPAIITEGVIGMRITDCYFHDLWDFSASGFSQFGYGVIIGGPSEGVTIHGVDISRCRHGIDTGRWHGAAAPFGGHGVVRGVMVSNCIVRHATDAAYSTHEAEGVTYASCMANNCDNAGFYTRGRGVRFLSCSAEWCGGGISVGTSAASGAIQGSGTQIIGGSIRHMKNITPGALGIDETGSNSSGGGGYGVQICRGEFTTINGLTIECTDRAGIYVRMRARGLRVMNTQIHDANMQNFSGGTGNGIYFQDPDTGTGTMAVAAAGVQVLTVVTGAVPMTAYVGGKIYIQAGPNAGTYNVTAITPTTITFDNGVGVLDGVARIWEVEGASDCWFENVRIENRVHLNERGSDGSARYGVRIDGLRGNTNNTFCNVRAIGMVTGLYTETTLAPSQNYWIGVGSNSGLLVPYKNGAPVDTDFQLAGAVTVGTMALDNTGGAEAFYVRTTAGWLAL